MKHNKYIFDIVVVGAGHAGVEAAHIAAYKGCSVCLVTMDKGAVGRMSCNPSIGGLAKGQMVRELDVLGGLMGRLSDQSGLQYKMLNRSKGRSVWSPRAQIDKRVYERLVSSAISSQPNITLVSGEVIRLLQKQTKTVGVVLRGGANIFSRAVILTCGTFLSGMIHIGSRKIPAGRMGESGSTGITEHLIEMGFRVARLKTGTPPRALSSSVDWKKTSPSFGDKLPSPFSFQTGYFAPPNDPCFFVKTNKSVHDIIKNNLQRSPMYTGEVFGTGPRYCPSIEDKIKRFADNPAHHLLLEPEWKNSDQIYINGFSTSLPEDVQIKSLKKIPAFKNIELLRPGYAIEYDFFPPSQLKSTLESKNYPGLFFAGQVNGTSGYEEASAQGLLAGINAYCFVIGREPLVLDRQTAYIGVLVDDLVTKDTLEPYRMFTSRAEYRILLRYSNADERLYSTSKEFGLLNSSELAVIEHRLSMRERLRNSLKGSFSQSDLKTSRIKINQRAPANVLLKRPEIGIFDLPLNFSDFSKQFPSPSWALNEVALDVETEIKYSGYIKRHLREIDRLAHNDSRKIRPDFNYKLLSGLSMEAREKLSVIRPETLGQALRVSGITHSDLSVILVHLS